MASLIFFSPGDQDRQNFSLRIFLSLFVFQGHIIAKKYPISLYSVDELIFFFFNIKQCYYISVTAVNNQIEPSLQKTTLTIHSEVVL